MRVYEVRCPHCRKVVESGLGVSPAIGAPLARCEGCGEVFRTGRSYWGIMSDRQQAEARAGVIGSTIRAGFTWGLLIGIIAAVFTHDWAERNLPDRKLAVTWATVLGILAVFVGLAALRVQGKLRRLREWEPSAEEKALENQSARET